METVLYIVHILVCIAMLPIILLQSGKGGGVSAVFGGGGAGTVFGSRGASNFLTRMTTGAAIVFMCTSIALSIYSSKSRSVVADEPALPAQTSETAPSVPKDAVAPTEEGAASTGMAPAESAEEAKPAEAEQPE